MCAVRSRGRRQEVEQLIAEHESSGLSQSEFCRKRGLGLSTLSRYRSRRERQSPAGGNVLLAVEVSKRAPASFATTGTAFAVVLRYCRRIEVWRGFNMSVLGHMV